MPDTVIRRYEDTRIRLSPRRGFTLIELLVAMIILSILVIMCAQMFQQAQMSWEGGSRKADMNLAGRAVADFIAQEISRAVLPSNGTFACSGSSAQFQVLDETNGVLVDIEYTLTGQGGEIRRKAEPVAEGIWALEFTEGPRASADTLPAYVDVFVTVVSPDDLAKFGNNPAELQNRTRKYQARAHLLHRNRYVLDGE